MQVQKDDPASPKSDVFFIYKGPAQLNVAELRLLAMRFLQRGHASQPIASHLQHDYLASIEGK